MDIRATLTKQKIGLIAIAILAVGFLGLAVPILLQWNRWILAFVFVRKLIVIPLTLSLVGLWLDRPKYAALIGLFLTAAIYISPRFIKLADAAPSGKSVTTIVCFIDQSRSDLEHITLNVGDSPMKLPKNKYWSGVAKMAPLPIIDTPELSLTADVGFVDGNSIFGHDLPTKHNGERLNRLLVFIRPDRTLETIPFY